MKKIFSIATLLLGIVFQVESQSVQKDFVIIGEVSNNLDMQQIKMRYQNAINAYFVQETSTNALEQIANALVGHSCENLHIFLQSRSNALIFNSLVVTSDNVNAVAASISKWKSYISGKIVIHSTVAFTTASGEQLKQALENASGLKIETMM
jgi:hypothetical protein